MEIDKEIQEYALTLFTNEKGKIKTELLLIAGIGLIIAIINKIKLLILNRR